MDVVQKNVGLARDGPARLISMRRWSCGLVVELRCLPNVTSTHVSIIHTANIANVQGKQSGVVCSDWLGGLTRSSRWAFRSAGIIRAHETANVSGTGRFYHDAKKEESTMAMQPSPNADARTSGFELGVYSFAELTPDPLTGSA